MRNVHESKWWAFLGVTLFLIFFISIYLTADHFGLSVSYDSGNPETGSGLTVLGLYLFVLAILLSWRIYRSILNREWFGGITKNERVGWQYLFLGSTIFAPFLLVLGWADNTFKLPAMVFIALVLAFGKGTWVCFSRLYRRKRPSGFSLMGQDRLNAPEFQIELERGFEATMRASEFNVWADGILKLIKKSLESEDAELREAIKCRRGAFKPFFEEALPIAHFLQLRGHPYDRIEPRLGNQPFDALWFRHGEIVYLECTNPIDGHMIRMQMELLEQHGHAPITTKLTARELAQQVQQGKVVWPDVRERSEILSDQFDRLYSAARNKMEKKYPKNTVLLIGDDFQDNEAAKEIADKLSRAFLGERPFKEIYLVALGKDVIQIY